VKKSVPPAIRAAIKRKKTKERRPLGVKVPTEIEITDMGKDQRRVAIQYFLIFPAIVNEQGKGSRLM